jgi:uncharacterized protein
MVLRRLAHPSDRFSPVHDHHFDLEARFRFVTANAKLILFGFMLLAPFFGWGALRALRTTSDDPRQWLPGGFAETETYDQFLEDFGVDELAIISWQGCTLSDPRVERLAIAFEQTDLFTQVLTGPRVLRQLVAGSAGVPPRVALERLKSVLIGADGRTTCLVLVMSPQGTVDRSSTVARIHDISQTTVGIEPSALRLAGPTVDAAAINAESQRMLFQLAGISAAISFCIAAYQLRSLWYAAMVFAAALYCTMVALAIVFLTGGRMNLLMTMLPPLIYILSTASAVHIINYFKDVLAHTADGAAAARAVSHAWSPCFYSAITTAIGFGSLATSRIDSIQAFGMYAAAGVLSGLCVLFLMMPAMLQLAAPKSAGAGMPQTIGTAGESSLVKLLLGRPTTFAIACTAVMALGGAGLFRLQSTVRLQARFLPDSKIIQDYQWLEESIGPMVPLEIVLAFGKESADSILERLDLVEAVQATIKGMPEGLATLSAVDFVRPVPKGQSVGEVVERRVVSSRLEAAVPRLVDAHYLANTADEQLWRLSVRADAISNIDYGLLIEAIKAKVDPLVDEPGVRAIYTGVIPLIYKAQRQLLEDLVYSFLTAFAVIALVFVVILRSVPAALLAMVPNLFPVAIVFGAMGWGNIALQIGSIMTASAALGIAVDDTIHFLTWFRRGIDAGMTPVKALQAAFSGCASAMFQTTLICTSGLLVFVASSFVPVLHFAYLMALLLVVALVGDLVFLPTLLASPLGAFFRVGRKSDEQASSTQDE